MPLSPSDTHACIPHLSTLRTLPSTIIAYPSFTHPGLPSFFHNSASSLSVLVSCRQLLALSSRCGPAVVVLASHRRPLLLPIAVLCRPLLVSPSSTRCPAGARVVALALA
ncbi:hypothetical protein CPC08DRAFT_714052, partial [Agrocybe pediades]